MKSSSDSTKQRYLRHDKNNATYLFELEDALVGIMLQLLIGVVNTELLKAVFLKVLKSKHIQDTNGQTLKAKTAKKCKSKRIRWGICFQNK